MYLIVGLGNPGREYAETRHNVGFRVIYELANKHKIAVTGVKYKALIGQGLINGEKVILAQPQTYMNLSGEAVAPLMNYFKVELENLLVIYDDLDLEPGKLRMRGSGSPGGHNGIKSLIDCLGTKDFSRIRVGIGRPAGPIDVRDFVLSKFFAEEKPLVETAIKRSCEGVELWLKVGLEKAMNQINRDPEEEARKEQERKEREARKKAAREKEAQEKAAREQEAQEKAACEQTASQQQVEVVGQTGEVVGEGEQVREANVPVGEVNGVKAKASEVEDIQANDEQRCEN